MSENHSSLVWSNCLKKLESTCSKEDFNLWLKPLQVKEETERLIILTPNQFVLKSIQERFLEEIQKTYRIFKNKPIEITLAIGSVIGEKLQDKLLVERKMSIERRFLSNSQLNSTFNFSNFIEGKSNQLARSAAIQVADNPGVAYNPLLFYGGVGLGKTHLLHAIGNRIQQSNPHAKVLYLYSERFVSMMVKAFQTNTIDHFKQYYRSLDCILIDDIQFFSGKERSQEEFFHTFNILLEGKKQIVLACDRYPKEIPSIEERLKSRLEWGLTVVIEPPDLETRVTILNEKALQAKFKIPQEVAFFVAKRIDSNIRELEGVLRRIDAYSNLINKPITLELVKEAIRDILALQHKRVTLDNIIETVISYYHLQVQELFSKKRKTSLVHPRQIAMTLAKELTDHSLPEIAKAFQVRNHTTVLYAIRRIQEARLINSKLAKDFTKLLYRLSAD